MNPAEIIGNYLVFSVIAGLAGAAAMTGVMALIEYNSVPRRSMIRAVGSLLTRSSEHAQLVGSLLHAAAAIGSGLIYTFLLVALGISALPASILVGAGIGLFHGLVVSLALVWVIADVHPLQEYQEAGPGVFLSHLAGHVAYGLAVGFVIGWSPL